VDYSTQCHLISIILANIELILFLITAPPTPTVITTEHTIDTITLHIGLSGKGNASSFLITANNSQGNEIYLNKSEVQMKNNTRFLFHVDAEPGTCFNLWIRALSADNTTSENAFPLFACYGKIFIPMLYMIKSQSFVQNIAFFTYCQTIMICSTFRLFF
jgi:hypothetical protein